MKYFTGAVLVILTAAIFLTSCSQGISPIEPSATEPSHQLSNESNSHNLWGLYTFMCDPGKGTVEVIPLREADMHLNALKFLEPPALTLLTIEGQPQFGGGVLDVDIGLLNPYLGWDQFSGFDVCGIVFTHGTGTVFEDPELTIALNGDARLLNADGYTRWWNPLEFPHGNSVHDYIDGLLGTPADEADFNCVLNGYKYFADGLNQFEPVKNLSVTKRGLFYAGQKNVRHYTINLDGELILNYAVDACWKFPSGAPPFDAPGDFPPEANRVEAWNVIVTETENTLHFVDGTSIIGGELSLQVDVYDHFNAGLNAVTTYNEDGLADIVDIAPVDTGDGYSTFELSFSGEDLTHSGMGELFIAVESEAIGYGGVLPGEPECAYFKYSFPISSVSPGGWALDWGGPEVGGDRGEAIVLDDSGHIYIAGSFTGSNDPPTTDLDPGPGEDLHTALGHHDAYLSKFTINGAYVWGKSWGGYDYYHDVVRCNGIAVDSSGNIYVAGSVRGGGVYDMDPGPGVIEIEGQVSFLSKFNPDGDIVWVLSWSPFSHKYTGITIDHLDNVYYFGTFRETADLDPGPGVDEHTSNGRGDAFLCKLDTDGNYIWGLSWGGSNAADYDDTVIGVGVDGSGYIYAAGNFQSTTDFDPGPDEDIHNSNGWFDFYISKFNSLGGHEKTIAIGGPASQYLKAMDVEWIGTVYITGSYHGCVDFDPGPGIEEYDSDIDGMRFLCKYDSALDFQWIDTDIPEKAVDVDVDGAGHVFLSFCYFTAYLRKYNWDGTVEWERNWAPDSWDKIHCTRIDTDITGTSYVLGEFRGTHDFDPGPGVDEHTALGDWDVYLIKFQPDGNW